MGDDRWAIIQSMLTSKNDNQGLPVQAQAAANNTPIERPFSNRARCSGDN